MVESIVLVLLFVFYKYLNYICGMKKHIFLLITSLLTIQYVYSQTIEEKIKKKIIYDIKKDLIFPEDFKTKKITVLFLQNAKYTTDKIETGDNLKEVMWTSDSINKPKYISINSKLYKIVLDSFNKERLGIIGFIDNNIYEEISFYDKRVDFLLMNNIKHNYKYTKRYTPTLYYYDIYYWAMTATGNMRIFNKNGYVSIINGNIKYFLNGTP